MERAREPIKKISASSISDRYSVPPLGISSGSTSTTSPDASESSAASGKRQHGKKKRTSSDSSNSKLRTKNQPKPKWATSPTPITNNNTPNDTDSFEGSKTGSTSRSKQHHRSTNSSRPKRNQERKTASSGESRTRSDSAASAPEVSSSMDTRSREEDLDHGTTTSAPEEEVIGIGRPKRKISKLKRLSMMLRRPQPHHSNEKIANSDIESSGYPSARNKVIASSRSDDKDKEDEDLGNSFGAIDLDTIGRFHSTLSNFQLHEENRAMAALNSQRSSNKRSPSPDTATTGETSPLSPSAATGTDKPIITTTTTATINTKSDTPKISSIPQLKSRGFNSSQDYRAFGAMHMKTVWAMDSVILNVTTLVWSATATSTSSSMVKREGLKSCSRFLGDLQDTFPCSLMSSRSQHQNTNASTRTEGTLSESSLDIRQIEVEAFGRGIQLIFFETFGTSALECSVNGNNAGSDCLLIIFEDFDLGEVMLQLAIGTGFKSDLRSLVDKVLEAGKPVIFLGTNDGEYKGKATSGSKVVDPKLATKDLKALGIRLKTGVTISDPTCQTEFLKMVTASCFKYRAERTLCLCSRCVDLYDILIDAEEYFASDPSRDSIEGTQGANTRTPKYRYPIVKMIASEGKLERCKVERVVSTLPCWRAKTFKRTQQQQRQSYREATSKRRKSDENKENSESHGVDDSKVGDGDGAPVQVEELDLEYEGHGCCFRCFLGQDR